MKEYVVGFVFTPDCQKVLLIRKDKGWQSGLYNGIGGHVEAGETPVQAMVRECSEETGGYLFTTERGWCYFTRMEGPDYIVHCFSTVAETIVNLDGTSPEREMLRVFNTASIDITRTVPNLKWLIPLAKEEYVDFPVVISKVA